MGKLQIITFTHPTHKFNTVKEARTQQLDDTNDSRNNLVDFENYIAKENFTGPIIVNDSYKLIEAQQAVSSEGAAAVSFGRWFVANPDLVERLRSGDELNRMDGRTLYSPGPVGYVDYQTLN